MMPTQEHRNTLSLTAGEVLLNLDRQMRDHSAIEVRSVPTQFPVLDDVLGGGLRAGEMLLLGGPPGVGKTICALQWARNLARQGSRAVFVCYEHEPATLLIRLLGMEAGEAGGDERVARGIDRALMMGEAAGRGLREVLNESDLGHAALKAVESYASDLILVRASGSHTTLSDLRELVAPHVGGGRATALFVDYLQKIPMHPEPHSEAEKVTRTVEGVKDLALDLSVPVVLLSAVDAEGMQASRLRMYHLRGSSAIAFESDVILMLNDKHKAISKVHLSYDSIRAQGFRDWVVMSVEKNRGGPNLIDLEFRKDFAHFRFDPNGGMVQEKLVSERMDESNL
jgi:replicative DNA helicase